MYIDGHTQVPYQTLRQMICDHGGRFDPFFTGSGTTHFVAENLSHAKLKQLFLYIDMITYRKSKQSIYVVSPDWITESVKAGKRQNESSFSIIKTQFGIQRICWFSLINVESFLQKRNQPSISVSEVSETNPEDEIDPGDLFQEKTAVNQDYLPEKVFSKSRFHVMGEIKRSLQDLVTREYVKSQSLPPSDHSYQI